MLTIAQHNEAAKPAELPKRKQYKEEPKKPWIYAYYALMAGTQKRQVRLQKEKFDAKVTAAKLLIKEQEEAGAIDQVNPAS